MSVANKLLEREEIQDFLKSHQGAASAVEKAAKYMEEKAYTEQEAVLALDKILPALTDKALNIFFSYKKVDEKAAKSIVKILRKTSAGKLKITYMDDFGKEVAGKLWREHIVTAVERANWFILLLPDPSDDWDWCLYETGLFEREITKADRIICLHHPDADVPNQINDYHAVPATIEDVAKFMQMTFIEDNAIPGLDAINPEVESDIQLIAKEIVEAIRPPTLITQKCRFEPWVKLRIENPGELADRDALDIAIVEDINNEAIDLFDRIAAPTNWGELRAGVPEQSGHDSRWREELFHVVRKIANGRKFRPIQAVFVATNGKIIRPLVGAVDRFGATGPIRAFHIYFLEEVGAVDASQVPQGVATLATLLTMAYRFRWEVLERYTKDKLQDKDVDRIENVLSRIEQDADSRRDLNEFAVKTLFSQQQAKALDRMFGKWNELRNRENHQGGLDVALKSRDTEAISKILKEIVPMNQEFLEIAAERFSEIISHMDN